MTDLEYVEIRKKEIKEEILALAPAYYLCPNCDGYGAYLVNDKEKHKTYYKPCKKCDCEGKLTWL